MNEYLEFIAGGGDPNKWFEEKRKSRRIRGRWRNALEHYDDVWHNVYICPFCDFVVNDKTNFCQECGADMREESE